MGDGKFYAGIAAVALLLLIRLALVLGIPVLIALAIFKYLGWL